MPWPQGLVMQISKEIKEIVDLGPNMPLSEHLALLLTFLSYPFKV